MTKCTNLLLFKSHVGCTGTWMMFEEMMGGSKILGIFKITFDWI